MRAILLVLIFAISSAGAIRAAEVRLVLTREDADLASDLRAASLTVSTAAQPDSRAQDVLAAARADYQRLIGILYAQGYYGPEISIRVDGREAAGLAPFDAPDEIGEVVLTVTPGPRFRFSRAEVKPLAPGTVLPEGFAPGAIARSTLIQRAARAGVNGWRAVGHAKARVADQAITADHRARMLDAIIRLAPGPELRFGRLLIRNESAVRPARIRAIAGLPVGETFSPDEVERSAKRLRRSGAFRSVALREAEQPNPDGTLDITATLLDEKKRRLGFGARLSSLEGLGISAYWLHRNLLGGAERLRVDGEVNGIGGNSGGIDFSFGTSLSRPATFSPDTTLTFRGLFEVLDEPDFFERKIELGVDLSHKYTERLDVSGGLGLRYAEVDDDLGRRDILLLTLPLGVTWDRRDPPLDPGGGFYLNATAEPFVAFDGSTAGARLFADARAYREMGERLVLAGRIQMGSVIGPRIDDVPPDMLFFSGGGGTVRGQPYQSLGVDLAGGQRVGGRAFLGLSGEVRIDVSDKIGLVGFADAGFIGSDSIPGGNGEWHSGAGLGLRYETGLGPIRLDVAAPVGGTTGDGVQLYIGIGQAF